MKIIFIVLLFFLIVSPVFAASQISVENEAADLGILQEGIVYQESFYVENTGDSDLIFEAQQTSCGCTKILEPKTRQTLAAQSKALVKFSFDTTGMFGNEEKYIYISSNDPGNSVLRVLVTADVQRKKNVIIDRFKSFGAGAVVGAGLADGINPCAFTVLVFFVSFLSFVGYSRKQVFILGSVFILSVFLTYLGIGLGIFEFFRRLEIFSFISRLIFYATAILAFVLGILSVYDWWVFKKTGDADKVALKLPGVIKRQIQSIIREKTDDRKSVSSGRPLFKLIFTALVCGFIVSLLESVCTGQLYLPTIVFVLGVPELKARAFLYLLLYNLMFIVPLLIIFGFSFAGVSSEGFAKLARMHLAKVKLLTAVVFFGLGLSLLFLIKK